MKKTVFLVLFIIGFIVVFLGLYWVKCQMGIDISKKYSLSPYPPFSYLRKK